MKEILKLNYKDNYSTIILMRAVLIQTLSNSNKGIIQFPGIQFNGIQFLFLPKVT
jgi:hypothetical protein